MLPQCDEPTSKIIKISTDKDTTSGSSSSTAKVILLVRHGHYKKSEPFDLQALTSEGLQQATRTAQSIPKITGLPRINRIVTSTLVRTKETAQIINNELEMELTFDPDLREGHVEKQNDKERFERAFETYFIQTPGDSMTTDLLICHSNIIKYLVCRAMNASTSKMKYLNIPHCSITGVTIRPSGNMHLNFVGSFGHLDSVHLGFFR